jgi:hypothetical protein
MAGESTANAISTFINEVWEAAVLVARENTVMAPIVTTFGDRSGLASRYFSRYTGGTVGALAETSDLSAQTFTPGTISVLTPAQFGAQYYITDLRLESDPFNVRADAARDLGELFGVHVDSNLCGTAVLGALTAGTVGSAGGTLTWANIMKAITLLRSANAPQPYYCVLAPGQWYHLAATIAPGVTITNMPAIQNSIAGRFFVGNVFGVDFYIDANITSGTAAMGAMFAREAIALDVRRAFRLEAERDASRGGGGYELNATMVYAYGAWDKAKGVQMIGTSVIP